MCIQLDGAAAIHRCIYATSRSLGRFEDDEECEKSHRRMDGSQSGVWVSITGDLQPGGLMHATRIRSSAAKHRMR